MKHKFLTLCGSLFFLLILSSGCQKEEGATPDNQLTFRAPPVCTDIAQATSYTANPLCLGEQVSFSFTSVATCGHIQIQRWGPTDLTWVQVAMENPTPDGDLSYTFTPSVVGNYRFRTMYVSSGGGCNYCNTGWVEATPLVVQECGCVLDGNSFSGTADPGSCDGTRGATYLIGSEDGLSYVKVQGGLTNFTGANADVYINGTLVVFSYTSEDGWLSGTVGDYTIGQRTPGNSSNRNIRVEGPVGECSTLEIHVLWNSTNTGGTITGQWSAKDSASLDVAPPVAPLTCVN